MLEVKRTMPELLITEELSIQRNHLSLVMMKLDLCHLRHGFWTSKKSMGRIRLFREWNQLVITGLNMIPYLPDGVYADLRTASNMRFQLQSELVRIQNRISRWFNIYFSEYKTVYGQPDAKSGMLILKKAPLPEDILTLGIDGVNQIWRDAKIRAVGKARAKALVEAAEHSVGSKEGTLSARMEIRMLLEDYESRNARSPGLFTEI